MQQYSSNASCSGGPHFGFVILMVLVSVPAIAEDRPAPTNVDFVRQIAPVLTKRCVGCHSGDKPESGLRLDTRAGLLEGGYSGKAVVVGAATKSRLVHVIDGTDSDGVEMPPKGERVPPAEIALLTAWINEGAKWPEGLLLKAAGGKSAETHWAFQPIRRPVVPTVRGSDWPRSAIDRFILARLESEGLAPSAEADRRTLIRRVTLDLIGLPPAPSEVDAFVADAAPDAYERVVDRLLASPHYGEKWARHWLDLAHYADTDGYLTDQNRPVAWRYRQWLVDALNENKPFDEFTIEQLAGDLLPDATINQRIATGFLRNTLSNREGGADLEEYRVEQIVDRVMMVSTAWMGLTIGCARCHDHKYDPLSQKEFYSLYSIFNEADEINFDAPLPGELEPYLAKLPEYQRKRSELLAPLLKEIEELQYRWEAKCLDARDEPGKDHIWDRQFELLGLVWGGHLGEGQHEGLQIIQIPSAQRTPLQKERILDYFLRSGSIVDPKRFTDLKVAELVKQLDDLKKDLPKLTRAPAMQTSLVLRPNYLHVRGDFRVRGIPVSADVPRVLPSFASVFASQRGGDTVPEPSRNGDAAVAETELTAGTRYQPRLEEEPWPNRLALAKWLVSPQHPLTARVLANRQWQEFFGRGLVLTSEDFGTQGQRPSHPELLDWLASDVQGSGFRGQASGKAEETLEHRKPITSSLTPDSWPLAPDAWDLKRLHRLIVTSAVYRQSSRASSEILVRDPANVLLSRQSAVRLSSEVVRDAALAASGLLNETIGGPCVFPAQPDSVAMEGFDNKWQASAGRDRYRRGLYTWHQRLSPFAQNVTFDAPASGRICSRRERSNTPLQALTLLNDPVFFEAAQALGLRVVRSGVTGDDEQLDALCRACLGRPPAADELSRLQSFVNRQRTELRSNPDTAAALFPFKYDGIDVQEAAAWTTAASVILNVHEFITRE